jgi:peptidoglycan/LPS O-acetylase OafA/YrhL
VRRLGHVPALDGLRGIAIASVLLFHTMRVPRGGFLGVDVFFVLSGFLITTLLIQEWQAMGRISLRHFYRRRALRLLPALLAMLTVFTFEGAVLYGFGQLDAASFHRWWVSDVSGVLYVQNIYKAMSDSNTVVGVGQLWSLGAEEQFYLVWPVVLIWLLRRRSNPRTIAAVAGGAAALILGHRVELVLTGAPSRWIFFSPTSRSDPIMFGCFIGVCYAFGLVGTRVVRAARLVAPVAACVGLMMIMTQRNLDTAFPGLLLLELATGVVLLASLAPGTGIVARGLACAPLAGLGRISYGVYVWHGLFLGLMPPALIIATVVGVACLSYKYVEKPFLRRKYEPACVAPEPRLAVLTRRLQ